MLSDLDLVEYLSLCYIVYEKNIAYYSILDDEWPEARAKIQEQLLKNSNINNPQKF